MRVFSSYRTDVSSKLFPFDGHHLFLPSATSSIPQPRVLIMEMDEGGQNK